MQINLLREHNLRGYGFEHIARMLLRRTKKNNFIFNVMSFNSLEELTYKYKLKIDFDVNFISINWGKGDLIEFVLDNIKNRNVQKINFYDVKTQTKINLRNYFEFCKSDDIFYKSCLENSFEVFVVSIILNGFWNFLFSIKDFEKCKKRIYSNFKKK